MTSTSRTTRRRAIGVGLVVLVGVVVAVAMILIFGGDEPDSVDAERALQQDQEASVPDEDRGDPSEEPAQDEPVEEDLEPDPSPEGEDPEHHDDEPQIEDPPAALEDLDGPWVVDRSREFDREEGRGTFAGYRIQEELAGVGRSVAVGRTPQVEGEVMFEDAVVVTATITADLSGLISDEPRRDIRLTEALGESPTATFELDEQIDLPEVPPVGEVIELTATGELTIVGTTNPVEVDLQAVVTSSGLVVAGSTVIELAAYDLRVPEATVLLSVSDEATIEWQLFLERLEA